MAISKSMRAALKIITALDMDVQRTYKLERKFEKITARLRGKPGDYHIMDREILSGSYSVPVRIFSPKCGTGPFPLLLYFHGGGWVTGGIEHYTALCTDLVQATGHTVALADYRLAPEFRFPTAPEDCYAVAKAFYTGKVLDIHPEDITLIGDSAGGNLTAAVSLMARDRGEFMPKRQILIYPVTGNDHSETSPFASVHENGTDYLLTSKRIERVLKLYQSSEEDLQNPYFAPLVASDLSNQPRTLILTAQYCPLRDEGEAYGKALQKAGNEVEIICIPDALHSFMMLPPSFTSVKQAHQIIHSFLVKR